MEEIVKRMMAERKVTNFAGILAGVPPSESVKEPMTPDVVFGASDFYDLCPVEEVLCSVHGITRSEVDTVAGRFLRSKGSAFHLLMQNDWFGRPMRETRRWGGGSLSFDREWLDPTDVFRGWWRCSDPRCDRAREPIKGKGNGHRTWIPMPGECPVCGNPHLIYKEPAHEKDGFKTHSDGGLMMGSMFHLELKTVGHWKFRGNRSFKGVRDEPSPGHVIQCILNMHTAGLRKSLLVYWDRSEDKLQEAFATHVVVYDEGVVRQARDKAEATREGLKAGAPPAGFAKCDDPSCSRARSCAARKHCPAIARS